MSLQERIEALRACHQELETALKDANARYRDDVEVHEIKKQKLAIKDEIAQLEAQISAFLGAPLENRGTPYCPADGRKIY